MIPVGSIKVKAAGRQRLGVWQITKGRLGDRLATWYLLITPEDSPCSSLLFKTLGLGNAAVRPNKNVNISSIVRVHEFAFPKVSSWQSQDSN